jgi:sarcosine oxidase subunit alpha
LWRIVAKRAVLAAGALERPIAFGGNDRPGVMLASAVRTYLNRFAVACGSEAVIFTTGDDGWRTAADMTAAGLGVSVVDARPDVAPSVRALAGAARAHLGAVVVDVRGGQRVRSVEILHRDGRRSSVNADLVAVAGGYNPQVGLTTHLGGKPSWRDEIAAFIPDDLPSGMTVAGACGGTFTLSGALRQGFVAGAQAAAEAGHTMATGASPRADDEDFAVAPLWRVAASRTKAFVDFQNDVTVADIALAAREGFSAVEHLKRYTTLGMATDQGKTSNVVGLAILAELTGRGIPQTGATRARPPHAPVAIGAFAGEHRGKSFRPTRRTAGHDWAHEQGAVFIESGAWLRAQWFPRPGERDWLESVSREVSAVRGGVGICDVSTLGKIELTGPDVGVFLDRVYANTFSTLPVGKARYGLMLREDGFVMDDGTTARLASERWVMSTTTANAAKVMQHLEFGRQALWPELDIAMHSVTERWAQFAVAGPRSRALLQTLFGSSVDLSNAVFPFMAAAEFVLAGVKVRLFRISFSGELAYEIAAPAGYGDALVRALMAAGRELDVTPYGLEALNVMRIEKGHAAGAELNGQTTARDLGLGRMMSSKKDFIGRVMAGREALVDPERPTLVGLRPIDLGARLRAGAHFLKIGAEAAAENDEGWMTSVAFSPSLGHWVGLGFVKAGPARLGERIRAYDPVRNGDVEVEVCSPVLIDQQGERLHG